MKVTVKYKTHLTGGEKSFTGDKAEEKALSFARKLLKQQQESSAIAYESYIHTLYQSKLSKEKEPEYISKPFLKVEFINQK